MANKTSFQKGRTKTGGRPKGTGRVDKLIADLESELPDIRAKVVEMAKSGDMQAIKLIWDRCYPVASGQYLALEEQLHDLMTSMEEQGNVIEIDAA